MGSFFRFLLIVILFILLIQLLVRWLFPKMVKHFIHKNIDREQNAQKRKEGDVTIEYNDNNKKRFNKEEGEYVDFEEVDD